MPGVVHVQEFGFRRVAAHHVARRAFRRERQEFGDQLAAEPDGMPALAAMPRARESAPRFRQKARPRLPQPPPDDPPA